MERKTIALCVCGSLPEQQDSVIEGVRTSCESVGINLLVFNPVMAVDDIDKNDSGFNFVGENMVFSLIPWDMIDGLILETRSCIDDESIHALVDNAKKRNIPTLSLNENRRGCFSILQDDVTGEASMVRHLVEEHGLKYINFISGIPDNEESERRLAGYKQVLEENNIAFEPERVSYGYFGVKAEEALQQFLESPLPFPQAIACANDYTAMVVCSSLMERGYKIPEDVIVVGYDGLEEAQNFYPSITTVRRGMRDMGEMAVQKMIRLWNNKTISIESHIAPDIVFGQSCGCSAKSEKQIVKMNKYLQKQIDNYKAYLTENSHFLHHEIVNKTFDAYLKNLENAAKEYGFDELIICLEEKPEIMELDKGQRIKCYGDTVVRVAYNADEIKGRKVPFGDLLPDIADRLSGEESVCYIFTPIYCKDHSLGYMARKITKPFSYRSTFRDWLSVNSAYLGAYFFNKIK